MKARANIPARLGQLGFGLGMLLGCFRAWADDLDVSNLLPAAAKQIIFASDIKPILEEDCLRCHGPEKPRGGFRLDEREAALKGGENGVDIVPGNSAKSPLIHFVAYQVEDMEMPPVGRGKQLTPEQISLLRAWIDQGAVWETQKVTNSVQGFVSLVGGGTTVHGDKYKFREQSWQKNGEIGGVEDFQAEEQTSPNSKWLLEGHFLPDDYQIDFSEDKSDLGFVHSGWQQFRKYYDDTGGYEPGLTPHAPRLGEDLYLDIGKAWIDFGLTLPDWPQMTVGYEYDYRKGNEATTMWNPVGNNPATARNIGPASQSISEGIHVIKVSLSDDISGVSVADDFRGEFYHLATGSTNSIFTQSSQRVNNGTSYFEGANTIRAERKFNEWFYASAGYLYSQLNADSSFSMDEATLHQVTSIPHITLEQDANVGNLNALLGPFDGLTISAGLQGEWSGQHGFGPGNFDQTVPVLVVPITISSDYDESFFQENLALRYSKIPYTGVYAEAKTKQDNINQYDQFAAPVDILNRAVMSQHTVSKSMPDDFRVGFDTSPWRAVSFDAYYRFYDDFTRFDSDPLVQPIQTGYPTFITSDDIITHEANVELALQPASRLKTTFSYQYQNTEYDLNTKPYLLFGSVVSPGGEVTGGREYSHIISMNASYTPMARLYLSTLFSYQLSSLVTDAQGSPAVVPYRGYVYTAMLDGTYVIGDDTDLFAGYFYSQADYGQNNYAAGLPLGIRYQQHNVQVALTQQLSDNVSVKLQYRFSYYDEPSSGGATNYRANSLFAVLTCRF